MATLTEFVSQLVNDVALAGSRGIASEDVERAIRTWHSQTITGVPAPPWSTTASKAASDNVVAAIWNALKQRRDIEIKLDAASSQANHGASGNADVNSTSQDTGQRVFTTAERTWQTIAGHGIKKAIVPDLQLALLSIIAAHGPPGILQPDMNKWAKQDKRSVPKRTDDLATKGYITKHRVVVGQGNQTTLLRLRRFATGEVSGPRWVKAYPDEQTWRSGDIVYYDTWFNETLRLIRQNEGIITTEDLRIGMGIHRQVRVRRTFGKCIDRIVKTGLLRKLKARLQPDIGQTSQTGLVNCLHLLREPTHVDRDAFSDPFDKVRAKGQVRRASKARDVTETAADDVPDHAVEDDSEDEETSDGETSDTDSDAAEPSSEATPNRTAYSLRNRDKSTRLIDALQDLGSDTSEDEKSMTKRAPTGLTKSRRSTSANGGGVSAVSNDDFLLVTASWAAQEWGFTKLQPCFVVDQQGHRNLVGGHSAARSPFKLINKHDSGSGVPLLEVAPKQSGSNRGRSVPGAYVQPPDAITKAKLSRRRKGLELPSESIIVVIKSDKLRDPDFLKPAQATVPPTNPGLTLPKRKRGRPSKADIAERQAMERALKEARKSSNNTSQETTLNLPGLAPPSMSGTNGYYHAHPPPAVSTRQASHLPSPDATSESGSTYGSSLKRKRAQPLDIESNPSKRSRSDGSLIARLPLPKSVLWQLEQKDGDRTGPGLESVNGEADTPMEIVTAEVADSDTINESTSQVPCAVPLEPHLVESPTASTVQNEAREIPQVARPPKHSVQFLPDDYSHLAHPKRRRGKSNKTKARDIRDTSEPAVKESVDHEMDATDEAWVARQFSEVPGVIVRRTAAGVATINNEQLVCKSDSLEVMSRPSRAYAFTGETATYKEAASISSISCESFRLHQRRLLMYPGQVFNEASGTIGTIGSIDHISATSSSVETSWKARQVTPNYLADLLSRAETLDCAKTGSDSTPAERFASEIECVRILEETAGDDLDLMDFGEGTIFVTHGLDCAELPWSLYALTVETDDIHIRHPPFDEDFNPKSIMNQITPPNVKSTGNVSKKALSGRRTSRKSDSLLQAADISPLAPSSFQGRTFSMPTKLNSFTGIESTGTAQPSASSFTSVPMQRFYPGPDIPSGPMLSLMKYGAPSTPSSTPFVPATGRAPPTPEASIANSSRSSTEVDSSHTPGAPKADSRPKPRKPTKANSNEDACDTCKRNHRTCYGGSATERCNFCAPTGALCSRVVNDRNTLATLAEREQMRMAQMAQAVPVVNQQPIPKNYVPEKICGRCRSLGKSDCNGGSATTRCGLCKTRRAMCSKNDVDRAKLIQWGRYTPETPATPAPPQSTLLPAGALATPIPSSVYSRQHHSRLQISPSQSDPQNNDQEQASAVGQKRKRTYTYKANEAAKDAAAGNIDEPMDQIFRHDATEIADSPQSFVGQSPQTQRAKKPKIPAFADPQRLCIAVALSNLICGGGDASTTNGINWDAVTHALAFKHEKSTLQKWWFRQRNYATFFDLLQQALGEAFLSAYEKSEIPAVDFEDLSRTDWPGLVRWVESNVLPVIDQDSLYNLPRSKEEFYAYFDVPSTSTHDKARTRSEANDESTRAKDMTVAKSFIRALTVTPEEDYDVDSATKKVSTINGSIRDKAVEQLQKSHTILRKKMGRQLPGRNYVVHKECLSQFARWSSRDNEDDFLFLRKVAEAWTRFVKHFSVHKRSTINPLASEADRLVITNMVAQGHLKMTGNIPELDKELLQKIQSDGTFSFPVEYATTPKFTAEHSLNGNVMIPSTPPAPHDDAIPFWVDIHGNLIDEVWDMVLRSVLHVLVFSPGSTAKAVEKAHAGHLWDWEIEMVMKWMSKVGVVEMCGNGVERGWRPTEWWYLAFSDDIATWETPDGVVGDGD